MKKNQTIARTRTDAAYCATGAVAETRQETFEYENDELETPKAALGAASEQRMIRDKIHSLKIWKLRQAPILGRGGARPPGGS